MKDQNLCFQASKTKGATMQGLSIKKTILALVGSLLVISMTAYSGVRNPVDAEGGNQKIYLPIIAKSNVVLTASDTTFFGVNATWKYFDKGTVPGSNWMAAGFNDTAWASGSAPLGYGNGGERTVVSYGSNAEQKYTTTYFRKTLTVDNPASITNLAADLSIDDGAVVYLNGHEVIRSNMPSGAVGNGTLSANCNETLNTTIAIAPGNLVAGTNTIAVEVHQCSLNSSDLAFSLVLHGSTGGGVTPTAVPTIAPTQAPTAVPTIAPTQAPTAVPTVAPTAQPTVPPTTGNVYYVSPSGGSGSGSMSSPWSLQYALNQPSSLRPGDTIWVRGGKYSGSFASHIKGASGASITVRAYPGERATLTNSSSLVLDIEDTYYVNFWGLEITSSYSTRSASRSESAYGIRVNQGTSSHHVKFINMVIHDVQAQGIAWWQALKDSEIYGSLFYFNGTTQLDHGIYFHNTDTTKTFVNNIVSDNASHGFHGYAETTDKGLNNLYMEGNTFFNNGSIGYNTTNGTYGNYKRNILVGGLVATNNDTITNNYTYYPGSSGTSLNLGYTAGSTNSKVTNNYFAGGNFVLGGGYTNLVLTGNTVYAPGGFSGFSTSNLPNNTWLTSKPSGVKVFVRPNKYETNRANITIYNWAKQSTVAVPAANLGGIAIRAGSRYELHNAQNFYGDVISGTYDGVAIQAPMTGRSVAQPVGLSFKPASTFPEFGAFILIVTAY
jgi:hypothetical protein